MKRIISLLLVTILFLFTGCAAKETEEDLGYDPILETFMDVNYGQTFPDRETVKTLRPDLLWGSNYEEEYQELLATNQENVTILKAYFGEDYTYSYEITSENEDYEELQQIRAFYDKKGYDPLELYSYQLLEAVITIEGNEKTETLQAKIEILHYGTNWYVISHYEESVSNFVQ